MAFDVNRFLQDILPVGLQFGGTLVANRGNNQAAAIQEKYGQQGIDLLRQIYEGQYQNLAPYANAGNLGLNQLMQGMGIRVPKGGAQGPLDRGPSRYSSALLGTAQGGGRSPSTLGRIASGAGTGAAAGSFLPGVGTAVGAGVGALAGGVSSLFHRNARQADTFTGLQSQTDKEIQRIQAAVDQARQNGTLTKENLQEAMASVQGLQQQFYAATEGKGVAGEQGRADYHKYYDPLVSGWQNELGNLPADEAAGTEGGEGGEDGDIGFGEFNKPFDFTTDPRFNQKFMDMNRPFEASDFTKDPGYDFRLGEGQKAIERSNAARGILNSGGTLKALERYGQNFASNEFQNAYNRFANERSYGQGEYNQAYGRNRQDLNEKFNRLFSLTGLGANAANAQNAAGNFYGLNATNLLTDIGSGESAAALNNANNYANLFSFGGNTLSDILRRRKGQGQSGYNVDDYDYAGVLG